MDDSKGYYDDEDDIDVNNDKNVDEKGNFGDDFNNVDIENKYEDDDKTGKCNDVDDDQTFESSGKVSKRAPHQADQRVVSWNFQLLRKSTNMT